MNQNRETKKKKKSHKTALDNEESARLGQLRIKQEEVNVYIKLQFKDLEFGWVQTDYADDVVAVGSRAKFSHELNQ